MDARKKTAHAAPMPLGDAIKRAYGGRHTQTTLATELGVEQGTVSKWATGATLPTFDQVRDLEDACRRPHGFVLRLAGYVDDPRTTEQTIANDPRLSDDARATLIGAYKSSVDFSKSSRA